MITAKRTKKDGRLTAVKLDVIYPGWGARDWEIIDLRPKWNNPHCRVTAYNQYAHLQAKTYTMRLA